MSLTFSSVSIDNLTKSEDADDDVGDDDDDDDVGDDDDDDDDEVPVKTDDTSPKTVA